MTAIHELPRTAYAPVLTIDSTPRRAIYAVLLSEPDREWTVAHLAQRLPAVSVEAIRTTVYLLLGDRLMDLVPRRSVLTMRLTDEGCDLLHAVWDRWFSAGADEQRRS